MEYVKALRYRYPTVKDQGLGVGGFLCLEIQLMGRFDCDVPKLCSKRGGHLSVVNICLISKE